MFEITILGSSGGPIDGKTCSILLKSSQFSYNQILDENLTQELLCIDAGVGTSGLSEMIYRQQTNQTPENSLLSLYRDSDAMDSYFSLSTTRPFKDLVEKSPFQYASDIINALDCYLITHPHLDHIAGMVMNSASFSATNPKLVYGTPSTVDALRTHVFNDVIWPKLRHLVLFKEIDVTTDLEVNSNFVLKSFELAHGIKSDNSVYLSTAFLLYHRRENASLLVFGDFESDLNSGLSKNIQIWTQIAPLILSGEIKGIILECSNINLPKNQPLFGHLTPDHLIGEFLTLKKILVDSSGLDDPFGGLHILITHVKESRDGKDPRRVILAELTQLAATNKLNLNFSLALPGVTYLI